MNLVIFEAIQLFRYLVRAMFRLRKVLSLVRKYGYKLLGYCT